MLRSFREGRHLRETLDGGSALSRAFSPAGGFVTLLSVEDLQSVVVEDVRYRWFPCSLGMIPNSG
jgi:hypothetical protein